MGKILNRRLEKILFNISINRQIKFFKKQKIIIDNNSKKVSYIIYASTNDKEKKSMKTLQDYLEVLKTKIEP